MHVYNWENSSRANRPKVKKTGTVVFHTDETVDPSFDRLTKEHPLSKTIHQDAQDGKTRNDDGRKAPLMTPKTVKELKKMGFTGLLPCQAQCFRGIFSRRDVILHSHTGSGKTLAYALPIIERHLILEVSSSADASGPFLLIFVFSNELAVQTRGVLARIYPQLHIGVAGFDDLAAQCCDIVVGTIRSIDKVIRGKSAGAGTAKRVRETSNSTMNTANHEQNEEEDKVADNDDNKDEDEDVDEDDEEDVHDLADGNDGVTRGVVSAAHVRAIVVDEVDLTLGPRFSTVGRRMRNLLKFIRRANGALTEGLLTDFRAHHYVLCGATIPNWVIKAGFLGVKKYYYQLVTVGTAKLPERLDCFAMHCPHAERVAASVRLLTTEKSLGRTVIFGTRGQIKRLEEACTAANVLFRSLNPERDELDRIAAMEDFNSGTSSVLLCTDLAARGLDFVDVQTVLMLSLPSHNMSVETFVHRAGRTARAKKSGNCLLLHDEREKNSLEAIEKNAHVTFKTFIPATSGDKKSRDAKSHQSSVTGFMLTVKNPFKYSKPNAVVPTALDVLKKNLEALFLNVSSVTEDSTRETVTFEYPACSAHEVKKKLWKYTLKEVSPSVSP